MKLKQISKGQMPPEGKDILVCVGTILPRWLVAEIIQGISQEERQKLSQSDKLEDRKRARTIKIGDEHGNNHVPYCFEALCTYYIPGQDVDFWCELPTIDG